MISTPDDNLSGLLTQHQIELPDDQIARLDQYCRQLWSWNEQLNLTRHTDFEKFVTRDLVDTLQLSQLLRPGEEVLDVGSGGGVPGVALAILRPDLKMSLSESVAKKCRALESIVAELELPAAVFHARAEHLLDDFRFDALIARAVGPLWKMCKWFEPHWAQIGRLLVIKGPHWVDERQEARHRGYLRKLELRREVVYETPRGGSESVILKIWPKGRDEP